MRDHHRSNCLTTVSHLDSFSRHALDPSPLLQPKAVDEVEKVRANGLVNWGAKKKNNNKILYKISGSYFEDSFFIVVTKMVVRYHNSCETSLFF